MQAPRSRTRDPSTTAAGEQKYKRRVSERRCDVAQKDVQAEEQVKEQTYRQPEPPEARTDLSAGKQRQEVTVEKRDERQCVKGMCGWRSSESVYVFV